MKNRYQTRVNKIKQDQIKTLKETGDKIFCG